MNKIRAKSNLIQNLDWVLLSLYFCLAIMGWLNIYAASYNPEAPFIFDMSQEYGKQFFWLASGLLIGVVIFLLESRFLIKISFPVFLFTTILLILVVLFGKEVNGAKSWFGIGSFGIQPSEFSKIGTTMMMASFLSELTQVQIESFKTRVKAVGILLVPAALIMLQPDMGTVLVFVGFTLVFYREGISGNILLFGFLAATLGVTSLLMNANSYGLLFTDVQIPGKHMLSILIVLGGIALFFIVKKFVLKRHRRRIQTLVIVSSLASVAFVSSVNYAVENILSPHQSKRVNILLGLEEDPQGAGYNVKQSKIAIGSGGLTGKGFLSGTLTKYKYVPMQSTDFIFCTVGEEWGFLGSLVVISFFIALILRIVFIAERQRSSYTRIFAYCIASILFMHLTINVGMTIGLAPVIGIPLPFFSYGGSSLWAFSVLIFALARLDAQRLELLR